MSNLTDQGMTQSLHGSDNQDQDEPNPNKNLHTDINAGCDDMADSMMSMDIREQHDPSLDHLARSMFDKTASYLQGELTLVQEDYKLLENLNKATASKYSDMRQISTNVARSLEELNEKYKSLEPHLRHIDQIEDSVNKLEQAAYKLDSYSKRLEAKFKSLEKRQ